MVPVDVLARPVALEEHPFGDPVDRVGQCLRVGREPVEEATPFGEHFGRRCIVRIRVFEACGIEDFLDLQRCLRRAIGQRQRSGQAQVVADVPQRLQRISEFDPRRQSGLDESEDEGGRAEADEGRGLCQGGVADDHVQPTVLRRIGVRFVTGVDDGAAQGRLEAHFGLEEVGTGRDLEALALAFTADADASRTAQDLSGDEEGNEACHDVVEVRGPVDEVVLMGAVGGSLGVRVVLVQVDRFGALLKRSHRFQGDEVACSVEGDDIAWGEHLRGGVFGVGVVDVVAGAVLRDDVRQILCFDIVLRNMGQLRSVGIGDVHEESARIGQRGLGGEVPEVLGRLQPARTGIGVDDTRRVPHRVRPRIARLAEAELRLGSHDAPDSEHLILLQGLDSGTWQRRNLISPSP